MVDRYRIVRLIGKGGMGEVYEAWDVDLQRRVAIKILAQSAQQDLEVVERFKGEGRALARLNHPHVVSIYAIGEHEGRAYMAMEFIDGLPLNRFLFRHPCGLPETLELFRQLLEGLSAAHAVGIVHRDLKPSNIVVDRGLVAKIVDFGIAKVSSETNRIENSRQLIGTTSYLAPEIAYGDPATVQTDIFSLGLVFYFMLTGQKPFDGHNDSEIMEKICSTPLTFSPHLKQILPESLRKLVTKMTAKIATQRYANAAAILEDLNGVSLRHLPDDLLRSASVHYEIVDYDQLRKHVSSADFEPEERRLVINLAASLQQTQGGGIQLQISDHMLHEACIRFQRARRLLRPGVEKGDRPPAVISIEVRQVVMLLSLVVIALSGLYLFKSQWPMVGARKPASQIVKSVVEKYPLIELPAGMRMTLMEREFQDDKLVREKMSSWELKGRDGQFYNWQDARYQIWRRPVNPFLTMPPLQADTFFPLELLKTASYRLPVANYQPGARAFSIFTCKVTGQAATKIHAGTFDTLVVQCDSDTKPYAREIFYFAPKLGHWVLRRTTPTTPLDKSRREIELLAYSGVPKT